MDSNTHSTQPAGPAAGRAAGRPGRVDRVRGPVGHPGPGPAPGRGPGPAGPGAPAAGRPPGRPMAQRTGRGRRPRRRRGRRRPPGRVDRGLAAEPAASGCRAATRAVRTARALFRGPLTATAQAVTDGAISVAHAEVVAAGTQALPDHVTVEAEPVLVEAARRLDPPRLRRVLGHLLAVADPDGADHDRERRQPRRGLWLAPTFDGMVAVDGLLGPEAGQSLLAALEPLARPADAQDTRSGSQRTADALAELARRSLEAGRLPQTGGVRPQLTRDRGPGQPPRPPRCGGWGGRLGRAAGPRGVPAAGL